MNRKHDLGDGYYLRRTDADDRRALCQLIRSNYDFLAPWSDAAKLFLEDDSATQYCRELDHQQQNGHLYQAMIFNADDQPQGLISLYAIDRHNRSAKLGYLLGESAQGLGLATRGAERLVDRGFRRLQLNRIEAECLTTHAQSARVPERLGFVQEGVCRQAKFVHGQYHDVAIYARLYSDWAKAAE